MIREVPHFLPDFVDLREHLDGVDYAGVTNPEDGIEYPGVSTDIPTWYLESIYGRLESLFDRQIVPNYTFLRLATEGMDQPHQAHTDASMGDFSLILYLNRPKHCKGGTSLVEHIDTGMAVQPRYGSLVDIWKRDTNKPEEWREWYMCPMESNKGFVFTAALMHRAEPVGGFGKDATDGRLILACFFNLGGE